MGSNKQKRYDEEFKASAVKMITEKGRKISEVARSLDVSEPALRRWLNAAKEPADNEDSRIKELEQEIRKLKNENDDLKDTVDVLKKSIAIFV
ncbi:MAG: transposase [Clostridiales bacterium]|nr:transposase [Clostridiales bacterium]